MHQLDVRLVVRRTLLVHYFVLERLEISFLKHFLLTHLLMDQIFIEKRDQ